MHYIEESVTTADGLRLHLRRCEAPSPTAEVVLTHGFGEHSGRYGALTEHLVRAGYSVTAYDHRGHGQSEGLPGHVEAFSNYEEDLDRVIGWIASRAQGRNLFIVGHSMGGLVTLRYIAQLGSPAASRSGAIIAGAVTSAPLIAVAAPVPPHKLIIGRVAARLAPRLRLDNEIDPAVLSRDPEVGRAYAADPLVNRKVSARWFKEAVQAMSEATARAPQIRTPLLVMHGTEDRLASFDATKALYELVRSSDKEMVVYEGYYHELFNEPEKEEVFARVTRWLNGRARSWA